MPPGLPSSPLPARDDDAESAGAIPAGERGAGRAAADPDGTRALTETIYAQLRAIAQRKLAEERPGHTLQATALVNEAYLRLEKSGLPDPQAGAHFYWAAAQAMRRILIEHARARNALKRGGGGGEAGGLGKRLDWSAAVSGVADLTAMEHSEDVEALDRAILRLSEHDTRAGDVVRLRFFAGLTLEEVARTLGISARSARRDWEYARAWLLRELSGPVAPSSTPAGETQPPGS